MSRKYKVHFFVLLLTLMIPFLFLSNSCLAGKKVVIVGSYRKHLAEVLDVKEKLQANGYIVLEPGNGKVINPGSEFVILESDTKNKKEITEEDMQEIENRFLNHICEADIVYVVNKGDYIGLSAAVEIGYAKALNKLIYCTDTPADYGLRVSLADTIKPVEQLLSDNLSHTDKVKELDLKSQDV